MTKGNIDMAVLRTDITYIKTEISEIKTRLDSKFVEKTEFEPIKRLVYGIVGLIMTAVIVAIVSQVIVK